MADIFLIENNFTLFREYVYLAWAETLYCMCVKLALHLFLHKLSMLKLNMSDNILYLVSFTFKLAKPKMTTKTFVCVVHKCTISGFCMIWSC